MSRASHDHKPPEAAAAIPARPCPICGRPAEPAHRPFCSPRCARVDLARWLGGRYVIAGSAELAEHEPTAAELAGEIGLPPVVDKKMP